MIQSHRSFLTWTFCKATPPTNRRTDLSDGHYSSVSSGLTHYWTLWRESNFLRSPKCLIGAINSHAHLLGWWRRRHTAVSCHLENWLPLYRLPFLHLIEMRCGLYNGEKPGFGIKFGMGVEVIGEVQRLMAKLFSSLLLISYVSPWCLSCMHLLIKLLLPLDNRIQWYNRGEIGIMVINSALVSIVMLICYLIGNVVALSSI